jgi:SNF2 family DNA or RNA helicase
MGLGKTIQVLLAAREAKFPDGTPRFRSILVLVKAATTYQWYGETKEWLDPALWSAFIIQGTKGFIPPGFRVYILSMDTMSRFMKTPAGAATLKNLNVDLVIVDECHSFKNSDSARSQALVAFLQDISISELDRTLHLGCAACEYQWDKPIRIKINLRTNRGKLTHLERGECPKCGAQFALQTEHELTVEDRTKGLVMLSGTPIKNRAEEYFIPLNLMRPDIFTGLDSFRRRWLTQDDNGKWSRIAQHRIEVFKETTKDFIIRREKNAVLSLPPFRRAFEKVPLEDENFKKAYEAAIETLRKRVDELNAQGKEMSFFEVQENLMTLRRIVGLAKVPFALEYVEEFLESVEDEKIIVGIHHLSVRDNLYFGLKQKGIKCLKLSGEDSAEHKNQIVQQFNSDPEYRVLICNMLAGGVGLNLQVANNMLTLERQWNAADEEQFEGRVNRYGQTRPVLNTYMVAAGIPTEDYFTTMIEVKRQTCGETLDGWSFTQDRDAVRDLVYKSLNTKLR